MLVVGLGVVGVLVAVFIGLAVVATRGESGSKLAEKIDDSAATLPQQNGFSIGSSEAPLVLQVYEDLQCPFCVKFTAEIEPTLIDEYVGTGKLRIEFRNFPILGNESFAAAEAVTCAAEQNRAWNLVLALYSLQANANQVDSEKLNVGRFDREGLLDAARQASIDRTALETCLEGGSALDTVTEHLQEGSRAGIEGTPGFVLNGQRLAGAPSDLAAWRSFLDGQLAAAGQ
jgi:protein-disulfide isomerase